MAEDGSRAARAVSSLQLTLCERLVAFSGVSSVKEMSSVLDACDEMLVLLDVGQ